MLCWIILVFIAVTTLVILTSTNWLGCSFLSHFLILFRLSVFVLPFFRVFMLRYCVCSCLSACKSSENYFFYIKLRRLLGYLPTPQLIRWWGGQKSLSNNGFIWEDIFLPKSLHKRIKIFIKDGVLAQ